MTEWSTVFLEGVRQRTQSFSLSRPFSLSRRGSPFALLELTLDQSRHVPEKPNLVEAQVAGPNIQYAQGAHAASTHEQRASRIEARPRPPANFRIVGKAIVSKGIGDQEELTSRDGMRAE